MIGLIRLAALCGVAGYVDAFGYVDLGGVFTANMTGNTVFLAIDLAAGDWVRAITAALTVALFCLGALAAAILRRCFTSPAVPLAIAAALLGPVHVITLPIRGELAVLAFAMGMQGASLSRFGQSRLQTVVLTGTMLNFMDAIAARVVGDPAPKSSSIALPPVGLLAYGAGAALSMTLGRRVVPPMLGPSLVLLAVAAELAISAARERAVSG